MKPKIARPRSPQPANPQAREELIHRWLGGQLRQRGCRLPAPVWKRMKRDNLLGDFLEAGDGGAARKALLEDARGYLQNYRRKESAKRANARRRTGARLPSKEEVQSEVDLSKLLEPSELRRATVLTRELARIAERHAVERPFYGYSEGMPLVAQFRDRYLNGRVLLESEAHRLMNSIGAAVFDLEFFTEQGIPLVGHDSRLLTPPDWDSEDARHRLSPRSEFEFCWGKRRTVGILGDRLRHVEADQTGVMALSGNRDLALPVIGRGSFMDRLRELAIHFQWVFPWSMAHAGWFILTGVAPNIHPIEIGYPEQHRGASHGFMKIELTVHPWLSATTLQRVYKRIQRIVIGPRNRPPKMKSLEFYDFVSEHRNGGATYPETLAAWTASHRPDRKKYPRNDPTAVARFTHQFKDIERQVLRPFGRPDREETKP